MASFPTKLSTCVVGITGAAGQIGYALAPMFARGEVLGRSQPIALRLLDVDAEGPQRALRGLRMELDDCAFPLLRDVTVTADPRVAFAGCDVLVMCGAYPRRDGMERRDLLTTNAGAFAAQGRVMAEVGSPHCRVVVVGNPANSNALAFATAAAPRLDPRNVSALMRLDHNRATSYAAARAGVPVSAVRNCTVWGNHSNTMVPDVENASIVEGGEPRALLDVCAERHGTKANLDEAYFGGEFTETVQQRGLAVIKARGKGSAASAASAVADHVRDWLLGTPAGTHTSMGVWSNDNPFGAPSGLFFSFPVTCSGGDWQFASGGSKLLPKSDVALSRIARTTRELTEEREAMRSASHL